MGDAHRPDRRALPVMDKNGNNPSIAEPTAHLIKGVTYRERAAKLEVNMLKGRKKNLQLSDLAAVFQDGKNNVRPWNERKRYLEKYLTSPK